MSSQMHTHHGTPGEASPVRLLICPLARYFLVYGQSPCTRGLGSGRFLNFPCGRKLESLRYKLVRAIRFLRVVRVWFRYPRLPSARVYRHGTVTVNTNTRGPCP